MTLIITWKLEVYELAFYVLSVVRNTLVIVMYVMVSNHGIENHP